MNLGLSRQKFHFHLELKSVVHFSCFIDFKGDAFIALGRRNRSDALDKIGFWVGVEGTVWGHEGW